MAGRVERRGETRSKTRETKRRDRTGGMVIKNSDAAARGRTREDAPIAKGKQTFSVVLKDVLSTVPEPAREEFVRTVSGEPGDGLDTALWGPDPSSAERREAALSNLRRQYESRRLVIETSLTRPEVAELLDVSEQAILDRLEVGDLIGLRKGREWRLPAWQFRPDTERGFVPGLAQLRKVFPGGCVSMSGWATASNAELGGATPADALAAGHVDTVLHIASTGTSAAW